MPLTYLELLHLLECIKRAHRINFGYSDNAEVGAIQAKLSIMLEVRAQRGDPTGPALPFKGCELDTDGDGNCHVHPKGCP